VLLHRQRVLTNAPCAAACVWLGVCASNIVALVQVALFLALQAALQFGLLGMRQLC
jgi:hypothetical protein